MLNYFKNFKSAGVLGINERNLGYVFKYNDRINYPLADNKIETKILAEKAGIAVPKLYGWVNSVGELKNLPSKLKDLNSFVIKPSQGCGGEGILVIDKKETTENNQTIYTTVNKKTLTQKELSHHIANTLHGLFSLGSRPDKAMIEYKVVFSEVFNDISFQGVPDIRIVSLKGIPVMAMLRLPTKHSGGKANLHQGAIGVGIDLSSGKTKEGVFHNSVISKHPDTDKSLKGREIPDWNQILEIAAKSYKLTKLGYQGVDIVLDKELGPLLLELNARPGLNIQLANNCGLKKRLILAEENANKLSNEKERINFAKENFNG